MNEYIKEIVESWGLGTDTHVITAIIVLMSVITMCAVFWLIFHLVSPKSSHFREMCFKVIICTTAVLLVTTTYVSIGGNVVIREELVTKENNANIRTSSISEMMSYDNSNEALNLIIAQILETYQMNPQMYDAHIVSIDETNDDAITNFTLTPFAIRKDNSNSTIIPTQLPAIGAENPEIPVGFVALYMDVDAPNEFIALKTIIFTSGGAYATIIATAGAKVYAIEEYNGLLPQIEVNPNMPYDPDFD